MGWRDREWAKFNDDEWNALYGVQRGDRMPAEGSSPAPAEEHGPRRPSRDHLRLGIWCAVAVAIVGVAILAYSGRPAAARSSAGTEPVVVYGLAADGAGVLTPGDSSMVCTEEAINAATGAWRCVLWTSNPRNLPVLSPHLYDGPCGHVVADQSLGAWLCVDAHAPRVGTVPPAPS